MSHKKEPDKTNLIDYLFIWIKWRKFIVVNFFIVAVAAAVFSMAIPEKYGAKAVVMPPQAIGADISSFLSNISFAGVGIGGTSDETNTLLAILNSRTLTIKLINHFDLANKYNIDNLDDIVNLMQENIEIDIQDDETITIVANAYTGYFSDSLEDENTRQLAMEMVEFILNEVDLMLKNLKTTQARYSRVVIEKRYLENKDDILRLEQKLREFQEKYGVISLPEQIEAAIETAANIQAQIVENEIKLRVVSASLGENHPSIASLKTNIKELKATLYRMKHKTNTPESETELFPVFSEVPKLGIEYLQLKRELEVQHKIYEFLTQQYEQAKLQEIKDAPTVQILDKAAPFLKRVSPKRGLTVLIAGGISVLLSCFLAVLLQKWNDMKNEDTEINRKITWIFEQLKSDLKFSRKSN